MDQQQMSKINPNREDRGVSINIEYVLTLSVALVMLTGLTTGLSGIVDIRQENVAEDQLEIAASEVASQLNYDYQVMKEQEDAVSRISDIDSEPSTNLKIITYVDTPGLISSNTYVVQIGSNGEYINTSTTTAEKYTVKIPIDDEIPVKDNSGGAGGDIALVYNQNGKFAITSQNQAAIQEEI